MIADYQDLKYKKELNRCAHSIRTKQNKLLTQINAD
jgi:hypothetical protein